MRVVVPYATLHPATQRWIADNAPNAELVALPTTSARESGYDPDAPECAYWRLLRDLWASGDDFMLVEHDMQPNVDSVTILTECPSGWCVYPYDGQQPVWIGHRDRHVPRPRAPRTFRCALGCTRFRGEFTARHPLAVEHMRLKHWRRLDSQLASFLFQHGEKACEHEPHVLHHHDYDKDLP